MKLKTLSVLFFVVHVNSHNTRIDPIVVISQGILRGQRASDGDYTTFLGIPYAVVDEDNPFGPSQPHTSFGGEIFRAYDGTVKCPQTEQSVADDLQTLDCLKLNIYVPNEASTYNPLPVLVWIHGGSFTSGSAGAYDVRKLVKKGIVVVTINYRLGPYGFMCLDVPAAPGNQGLKDQFAALRWIRNNIGSFGGNPYKVTIAGQNAGACSALLHLYSSKEKLFNKLIVESGTPQNEDLFVNGDVDAAVKLAQHLGFNTTDTDEALSFLASTPHNLVTNASSALGLLFRPCKERSFSGIDNFVEYDPYSLTNAKKLRNTPILIGHTSREISTTDISFDINYDPFYEKIAKNYNLNEDLLKKVSKNIRHYYIGDREVSSEVVEELSDFESDFVYNHPTQRMITKLLDENAGPVYEYLFDYVSVLRAVGAPHSAELNYLFDMGRLNAEEEGISDNMITMWTNFVIYGNPTPTSTSPVTWMPLSPESRPYLFIDKDMRMESRVFKERMAFWDLFYDNYGTNNVLARVCSI